MAPRHKDIATRIIKAGAVCGAIAAICSTVVFGKQFAVWFGYAIQVPEKLASMETKVARIESNVEIIAASAGVNIVSERKTNTASFAMKQP